jgi:GNAT superfamily N-acetyltransferase
MNQTESIVYRRVETIDPLTYRDLLVSSGFTGVWPVDDLDRMRRMIAGASLLVAATRGGQLMGVARCVTDFAWICYRSELAVSKEAQGLGVGKGLIDKVREVLGPDVSLALMSYEESFGFYRRIGMQQRSDAFWFGRER